MSKYPDFMLLWDELPWWKRAFLGFVKFNRNSYNELPLIMRRNEDRLRKLQNGLTDVN